MMDFFFLLYLSYILVHLSATGIKFEETYFTIVDMNKNAG